MDTPARHDRPEDVQIELLLEGVHRHYGYDFRNYLIPPLRDRIRERLHAEQVQTVAALENKVLHDPACLERLLLSITSNGTALFRDPEFYRAFRTKVVPILRTYPSIRIWHVGCSTGEETHSLALVLREEGLGDRCRIYATDVSELAIHQASQGVFPPASVEDSTRRYLRAGGTGSLTQHYAAHDGQAVLDPLVMKNLVWAQHSLTTDGPFNQFHVIICRDVLTGFNTVLQERAHRLFLESLVRHGFLCLGREESTKHRPTEAEYEDFDPGERIFRRIR